MMERLTTTFAGRNMGDAAGIPPISATHREWMNSLLEESPASMQSVSLGRLPCGDVTMEWQAVFQGAGVAYVRCNGTMTAVGMLLQGRFLTSEQAAIEAVQQTLLSGRGRSAGFELLRRQHGRPLRAIVLLEENASDELLLSVQYWIDCLAQAYFNILPDLPNKDRPEIAGDGFASPAP